MRVRNDKRRTIFCAGLLLTIASVLTGCGGEHDLADLKAYVTNVLARPKGAIEPLPEIRTVEAFVFDPEGLRNPFVPSESPEVVDVKLGNGIRPDTVRPREELESYSLDSLRMVGTVDMDRVIWGLVKASDGTIYRVQRGNYMGRNHGKIERIASDRIDLLEIVPDGTGAWRERQASLALTE
jgi:type IV pilus assembly protein PilP